MFYVKRVESEEFTVRNINGDILSQGKDPNHSYVICFKGGENNEEYGLDFNSSGELRLALAGFSFETITVYNFLTKFGMGSVMHFETESEAHQVLDLMDKYPDKFIRSSGWNR